MYASFKYEMKCHCYISFQSPNASITLCTKHEKDVVVPAEKDQNKSAFVFKKFDVQNLLSQVEVEHNRNERQD